MSSTPAPSGSRTTLETTDINDAHASHPSVATMKEAIGYAPHDEIRSAEAIAKYVAIRHPHFEIFPALPSRYTVNFVESTTEKQGGQFVQATAFEISIGGPHLRQVLGTVTVERSYETLSDARTLDGIDNAIDAKICYQEAATP